MMSVWIEPHERHEAIDAYKDRLTPAQIDEIDAAPETALVQIYFLDRMAQVRIVEEG